jgi:thiol:disulfide interchange protein DsbD
MYSKLTQWIIILVVILAVVFGGMHYLRGHDFSEGGGAVQMDSFWNPFSEEAVARGITEGRPVFVNFTAAFCTVCKMNDVAVFNQSDIRAAFNEKDVYMLKGDLTRRNDVMLEWLFRHNRAGVPLYLLFVPGEDSPIQFPEVLTKSMMFDALNRL